MDTISGKKRDQIKSPPWGCRGKNREKVWILIPAQGLKLLFQHLLLMTKVSNPEYSKESEKLVIPSF